MRSWKFAWLFRNGGTNHFKTMAKSAPWLPPFYLILYWFCFIIFEPLKIPLSISWNTRRLFPWRNMSCFRLAPLLPRSMPLLWHAVAVSDPYVKFVTWTCVPLTFDVPATLRPLGVCSSLPMAHVGRSKANCEYRSNLTRKRLLLKRASSFTWVCLTMSCSPKPNGFADHYLHYPYEKWLAIIIGNIPNIFRQTHFNTVVALATPQFQQPVFFLRRNWRGKCHTAALKNGNF